MKLRDIAEDFLRAVRALFGFPVTVSESRRFRKEMDAQEDAESDGSR